MQRICSSLAKNGYDVLLVGRVMQHSLALQSRSFGQKRLKCLFYKGALFYAEYNLRLFFFLLWQKMDAVCAIDLDTILPCYFVSLARRKKRIYDAHELFTEMKEVVTRPFIQKQWMKIERFAVPKFPAGYTVSNSIADEFKKRYDVLYHVVRNVPVIREKESALRQNNNQSSLPASNEKFLLYQGAINEARGLENLIEAMKEVECSLYMYGDGNLLEKVTMLIAQNNLQDKIFLKGKLEPGNLYEVTTQAYIGINLVEPVGLNQVYSLANKFFDYIQAGVPQVTMNFPEYKNVNEDFEVAVLIDTVEAAMIADAINNLLLDQAKHEVLKKNCLEAAKVYNWQEEEKRLLSFYKKIMED
ncbi:MAG: glycosyltransferase [Bacteroidetes bacterium]|nr:glycosyltransferase [Bacteroidota bacterium]